MDPEELEAAILRVRDLIADPAGDGEEFSDEAIERAITANDDKPRRAAIDLLVQRLGALRDQFDVAVGDLRAERSQQITNVESQLRELRRGASIQTVRTYRSDL